MNQREFEQRLLDIRNYTYPIPDNAELGDIEGAILALGAVAGRIGALITLLVSGAYKQGGKQ